MDTGTGYGRPPATYLRELTEVGPRHTDGRAAAPLLASGRSRRRRGSHPPRDPRRQLGTIAAGGDPINVSHDASAPPVVFEAGNFLRES